MDRPAGARSRDPNRQLIRLILLWTIIVAASLTWNGGQTRRAIVDFARAEARGSYNKDLIYRRWASRHGGVYVPKTELTPPNPYLSYVDERDITTPTGKQLTLVNPAYMTRQVHELGRDQYGHRGHITSLNPLRPENAADPWETEALLAFEHGETEISSIETMDGQPYLRLMHAMITERSCLKCHAHQGYKLGEVRGGISVSVPMAPYNAMASTSMASMILGHGLIWVLGITGIFIGCRYAARRLRERDQAEQELADYQLHLEELVEQRSNELVEVNRLLRRERDNFLSMLESMEDGAYVADEDFNIEYANPALTKLLGPFEGRKCYEYLDNRTEACPNCWLNKEKPEETGRWEWHSTKNGNTYEVLDTTLNNSSDGRMRKLEVLRDVSERKRAEQKLREYAEALEYKNAELNDFVHIASHDLQEPLRKLVSFSKLLRTDAGGNLPQRAAKDLDFITDAATRMHKLIQSLLALSRAGRAAMKTETVSLADCANRAIEALAERIAETRAEIKIVDDLPDIKGDATLLTQLYQNLIGNALKFVAPGQQPTIHLEAKEADRTLVLSVRDNGIGIEPEHRESVFRAFTRLHGRSEYEGSGIGLAICHKVVERHGGRIWIDPESENGTTFLFTLAPAQGVETDAGLSAVGTVCASVG